VPSAFTANALAELAHDLPIRILPHPIATCQSTPRPTAWGSNKSIAWGSNEPFVVLTMFDMASSMARKNPLGAIRAFKAAFGEDPGARLVIKCANLACFPDGERELRCRCPEGGNVVLLEAFLDRRSLEALYAEADAVISLHRSEGFGLILAEAMLRGLPVVATGWSGNTDFLSEATGLPIGYQLVPAIDPQNTYEFPDTVWAEPNITQAAQALRGLRADPARARALGEKAAAFASATFGLAAYAEAIGTLGRPSTSRSVRSADAEISTIAAMQAL
jgi:glycosyltransferase involved in cell wall biosynthesis